MSQNRPNYKVKQVACFQLHFFRLLSGLYFYLDSSYTVSVITSNYGCILPLLTCSPFLNMQCTYNAVATMALHAIVCLRLSVTLRYCGHIRWVTSKIITQINN